MTCTALDKLFESARVAASSPWLATVSLVFFHLFSAYCVPIVANAESLVRLTTNQDGLGGFAISPSEARVNEISMLFGPTASGVSRAHAYWIQHFAAPAAAYMTFHHVAVSFRSVPGRLPFMPRSLSPVFISPNHRAITIPNYSLVMAVVCSACVRV